MIDDTRVHLESLGKQVSCNVRLRPKHSICNCDDPGVLAVEGSNGDSIHLPHVPLEMDQADREHESVTLVQDLVNEVVIWV